MKTGYAYTITEYLRNPEVRKQLIWMTGSGAVCIFLCAAVVPVSVIPVLLMWGSMGIFHFSVSWSRYRRIAQTAGRIDRILHREEAILIEKMEEGELSILEDEINKMLVRLREQNLELQREKTYLSDSLTDLSHQLRTPLTSMNLLLSMLGEENLSGEKQFEYLGKLKRLSGRVEWLIDVLLKISRLEADAVVFKKQPCSVAALVERAVLPLGIPMELKELEFCVDIPEGLTVNCDPGWTGEAVANILKNCAEHTPHGGRLTVRGEQNALYTALVISDNGEGIAREDLPHLFERFYKGKNSGMESAGIGLALAERIVSRQNGMLRAGNGKNGGAEFVIRLYRS